MPGGGHGVFFSDAADGARRDACAHFGVGLLASPRQRILRFRLRPAVRHAAEKIRALLAGQVFAVFERRLRILLGDILNGAVQQFPPRVARQDFTRPIRRQRRILVEQRVAEETLDPSIALETRARIRLPRINQRSRRRRAVIVLQLVQRRHRRLAVARREMLEKPADKSRALNRRSHSREFPQRLVEVIRRIEPRPLDALPPLKTHRAQFHLPRLRLARDVERRVPLRCRALRGDRALRHLLLHRRSHGRARENKHNRHRHRNGGTGEDNEHWFLHDWKVAFTAAESNTMPALSSHGKLYSAFTSALERTKYNNAEPSNGNQ